MHQCEAWLCIVPLWFLLPLKKIDFKEWYKCIKCKPKMTQCKQNNKSNLHYTTNQCCQLLYKHTSSVISFLLYVQGIRVKIMAVISVDRKDMIVSLRFVRLYLHFWQKQERHPLDPPNRLRRKHCRMNTQPSMSYELGGA